MRGLNSQGITGVIYARDHGVVASGAVDDARAVQAAIEVARAAGGGVVALPADGTVLVDGSLTSPVVAIGSTLLIYDDVELHVPAGCTLRLLAGANCDLVQNADPVGGNSRIRVRVDGVIDGNRASQGAASNGIAFTNVTDAQVVGRGIISGCYTNGITLTTATRPVLDVVTTDNGSHGIRVEGTVRGVVCLRSFDNCRVAVAGSCDGLFLAGDSTDNVIGDPIAYDSAGAGGRQGYGVREQAASACDRNTVTGGALTTNRLGETQFVGAGSRRVIVAAHSDLAGVTPDQHHAQVHNLNGADHAGGLDAVQHGALGAGAAHTEAQPVEVQSGGVAVGTRTKVNFTGATVTDDPVGGKVDVAIPAAAATPYPYRKFWMFGGY